MKILETNDWLTLNNIIYKIYSTDDLNEMRAVLLENLEKVIDFDGADFFMTDNYGNLCNVIGINSHIEKSIYDPNKWHHSTQIVFEYNKKTQGLINLYRTTGKDNFSYDDIFILDLLKDHIAFRLYQSNSKSNLNSNKITIKTAVKDYRLTKREEIILRELLAGKDNNIICSDLVISLNTLKKHILNIYRKLGINNRVQMFKMIREIE